jgi:hypothetical protein
MLELPTEVMFNVFGHLYKDYVIYVIGAVCRHLREEVIYYTSGDMKMNKNSLIANLLNECEDLDAAITFVLKFGLRRPIKDDIYRADNVKLVDVRWDIKNMVRSAIEFDGVKILKHMIQEGHASLDVTISGTAIEYGSKKIITYLHSVKCPIDDWWILTLSTQNMLDTFRFLLDIGYFPEIGTDWPTTHELNIAFKNTEFFSIFYHHPSNSGFDYNRLNITPKMEYIMSKGSI